MLRSVDPLSMTKTGIPYRARCRLARGERGVDDVAAEHGFEGIEHRLELSGPARPAAKRAAPAVARMAGGGAILDSAPVAFQPARRKKVLDGSVPCGCAKNGVKSFTALARPS